MRKMSDLWKSCWLHLMIVNESAAASVGLMGICIICLAMTNHFFPAIIGGILIVISLIFLNKTMYGIFAESVYGSGSILTGMVPVSPQNLYRGRFLTGAGIAFLTVVELTLALGAGYWSLHEGSLAKMLTGYVKWLYGWSSLSVSNRLVWSMFPLEILYLAVLAACMTAAYEYAVLAQIGKRQGRIAGWRREQYFDLGCLTLILGTIGFRALNLRINSDTVSLYLPWIKISIMLVVLLGLTWVLHRGRQAVSGRNQEKVEEKTWNEDESQCLVKYWQNRFCAEKESNYPAGQAGAAAKRKAYRRLVRREKDYSGKWQLMFIFLVLIIFQSTTLGVNSFLAVFLFVTVLMQRGQEWNRSILYGEYAAFYYCLPLPTKDLVRVHTMEVSRGMMAVAVAFLTAFGVKIRVMKGSMGLFDTLCRALRLGGSVKTGTWSGVTAVCLIWILIILVLCAAFGGWALYNSGKAAEWKDSGSDLAEGVISGLYMIGEVLATATVVGGIHCIFNGNPVIRSLVILAICIGECLAVWKLNIRYLERKYRA